MYDGEEVVPEVEEITVVHTGQLHGGAPKRAFQQIQVDSVYIRDGVIVYDKADHEVLQHFAWKKDDTPARIKMPKNESVINTAIASLASKRDGIVKAIPQDLKDSRVNVATFTARVLCGMDVPEGHVVVPINHERRDTRANNLAIAAGEGKNFKAPANIYWPEALNNKISWDGDILRILPRGLLICEVDKVFTVHYPKDDKKCKTATKSIEDVQVFVTKYMDYIKSDWPNNSPFKGWKCLDPIADEALKSDWRTANEYYTEMVESYKNITK